MSWLPWTLEYTKRGIEFAAKKLADAAAEAKKTTPPDKPPKRKRHASKPERNDRASDSQVADTIRKLKEKGFDPVVLPPNGAAYFSQGDKRWAKIPFPKWKRDPDPGKEERVDLVPKIKNGRVVMEKDPATGKMRPVMEIRTLRGGGCGPTSLAIAIATLRPDAGLTPTDVADFAVKNHLSGDAGSSGANMDMVGPLTKEHGLKSVEIKSDKHKIENLRAGLDKGGVAVVHVKHGIFNYKTNPDEKGRTGHFIAVIGYAVDKDGKEWFFVANPGKDGSVENLPEKGLIVDKDPDHKDLAHHGAGMVRVSRETLEKLMRKSYMVTDPKAPAQ